VYHIQTEDGGIKNPVVVTHLFFSGAIVSSRKTGYSSGDSQDGLAEKVKGVMKDQHRAMMKDLLSGRYRPGATPPVEEKPKPQPPPSPPIPQQKKVAQPQPQKAERKSLDDLILDYLSSRESEESGR
jgi:hypothetical protein